MTFKSTLTVLFTMASLLVFWHWMGELNLIWLWLPPGLLAMALIYGSSCIQSGFFAPAHCQGTGQKKHIALTFDDGPDANFTPQILAVLEQYRVPATFFVIGSRIPGNETLLKQMDAAGHIIASHSYSHAPWIDFKSANGFAVELQCTEDAVFAVLGKRPALFRPPFGVMTPHLVQAAARLNYKIIGWSVRSLDTMPGPVESIVSRVQRQMAPGAVILLHDTSEKTVEVVRQILDFAKHNDYIIVNSHRLLNVSAYK